MIQKGHLEESISLSLKTYQTFKPCPVEKVQHYVLGCYNSGKVSRQSCKDCQIQCVVTWHLYACVSQVKIIAGWHRRFLLETSATALSRHRRSAHTEMNEVPMLSFSCWCLSGLLFPPGFQGNCSYSINTTATVSWKLFFWCYLHFMF